MGISARPSSITVPPRNKNGAEILLVEPFRVKEDFSYNLNSRYISDLSFSLCFIFPDHFLLAVSFSLDFLNKYFYFSSGG